MLNELQRALEILYGVRSPHRVEDFVLGAEALARLGARVRAPEELFVVESQGEVELGLYLAPEVLEQLSPLGSGSHGFLEELLPAFTTAAEGVSHFVYLTLQTLRERAVSLLELEVQAEVDKYALALLHLWKHGERRRSSELRERLFERVGFRHDLGRDERERYRLANRLGRDYAASLERRFVQHGRLEALLRELRGLYRCSASPKLEALAKLGA